MESNVQKRTIKKSKIIAIMRRGIQVLALLFFPGMFTTIFYAIKSVVTLLVTGTFSWALAWQSLLIIAGVFLLTLALGRIFCGFLCSFGAMGDLLWFISKKTLHMKWKMPQKWDKYLKWTKYGVFLIILFAFWILQFNIAGQMISPWTVFGIYTSLEGWSSPQYLVSIGGLLLLLIIVASLFVERFFCRYLCPLGALFALFGRFRPYTLKKPSDKCGNCRLCTHVCSMGIPLSEMDKVSTGECIECFQCMEKCPRENISVNPKPVVVSALSAGAITGMVYLGTLPLSQSEALTVLGAEGQNSKPGSNSNSSDGISASKEAKYKDGTYNGKGNGFRGETEVSVVVNNGKISDITVVRYSDDRQYFSRAQNSIISDILRTQDTDVATVSGATFSSNGIKDAVANALAQALTNQNGSAGTGGGNQTMPEEQESGNTSGQKEETQESNAGASSESSEYKDGTYTGTGTGFRGETEVSVTVKNGKITDITVVSYADDRQFFTRAENTIISDILESQNIDVATVSGATFSSNGIKEAVANALGQSFTNPNGEAGGRGHHGGREKPGKGENGWSKPGRTL